MILNYIRGVTWDLYKIFVIKEKHGFNKMGLGLFLNDKLKSNSLMIILGLPIHFVHGINSQRRRKLLDIFVRLSGCDYTNFMNILPVWI